MMQLIDKKALIAKIKKAEKEFRRGTLEPIEYKLAFADGVGSVADLIADAVPITEERKRGHWELIQHLRPYYICSECGSKALYVLDECGDAETPYCPWCGAKMDEEVKA